MQVERRRKPRGVRLSTRIPPDLYQLFSELATVRNRAVSEVLREFLLLRYDEIKELVQREKEVRGLE